MNVCQQCHEREAIVHLTHAGNGHSVTLHLCDVCAADRGIKSDLISWAIATHSTVKVADLMAGWLPAGFDPDTRCDGCGATLADYQASLRLRCDQCWTAFQLPLSELVRRFHGRRVHQGPGYVDPHRHPDAVVRREWDRTRIEAELCDAVAREAFEEAAILRDALRDLEDHQ